MVFLIFDIFITPSLSTPTESPIAFSCHLQQVMLSYGANQKVPRTFYRILQLSADRPAGYKNKNPYVLSQQNLYQWSDEQMILGFK
jgi:hypothetical protein